MAREGLCEWFPNSERQSFAEVPEKAVILTVEGPDPGNDPGTGDVDAPSLEMRVMVGIRLG